MKEENETSANRNSDWKLVENHPIKIGQQDFLYNGYLYDSIPIGKGDIRRSNNNNEDLTDEVIYEGELYNSKRHGQGTVTEKVTKFGKESTTTHKGEFHFDKENSLFETTKTSIRYDGEQTKVTTYQKFTNGVAHAYSMIERDGFDVHRFEGINSKDQRKYIQITDRKNSSAILSQNVTNTIDPSAIITRGSTSTEKKNGEGMDDK